MILPASVAFHPRVLGILKKVAIGSFTPHIYVQESDKIIKGPSEAFQFARKDYGLENKHHLEVTAIMTEIVPNDPLENRGRKARVRIQVEAYEYSDVSIVHDAL